MPEGLRNTGPMFCRMMKVALKDQVGRNILSYVDDIVIARKKDTNISDLVKTFANMHEARLKLNPKNAYLWLQGQGPWVFSFHEKHQSKPWQN
jgi:hypothetical protein